MATPTTKLRHVWRVINDGNGDIKVLALQQWHEFNEEERGSIFYDKGYWEDVEIDPHE